MTLIAAFRCDTYSTNATLRPGVVICADSQETAGDFRVEVNKIRPREAGRYDLIVGGSGRIAALIDGLANAIESNVSRWPGDLSEESVRIRIERLLLGYHARQVALYPDDISDPTYKLLRFVMCARSKQTGQIHLLRTDGTVAERVDKHVLLGWEEAAYHHEISWLYYDGIGASQAVLLGIHLFLTARNSLYIGGPTQVIVIRGDGMTVENPKDVVALESRVEAFNSALARLILAGPDMGLEPDEFDLLLTKFQNELLELYRQFSVHASLSFLREFQPGMPKDLYKKLPWGVLTEWIRKEMERRQGNDG